jgi:antitoxin MazE7
MTTIKVDTAVRDRLAALAKESGRTLGQEVAVLVERAEQGSFWDDIAHDYERLQADTQEWARYLMETQFGDSGRSATEPAGDPAIYRGRYPVYHAEPLPKRDRPIAHSPAA